MKLVSSLGFALFLATAATTEGFGPAQPVLHKGPVAAVSNSNGLVMNIGQQDLIRRQRLNDKLRVVGRNPSKELVEQELLSDSTETMIEKCNWKLRKFMIRKVRDEATAFGIKVDPAFGVPPTLAERQQLEKVDGEFRRAAKKAHNEAVMEQAATKRAAKKAAAEAAAAAPPAPKKNKKKAEAPAPAPPKAAAPAPAPEPAAAAPAPAPSGGGGAITPKTIKALRDATGVGMMDCKKALIECDGDAEAAAEELRKKGLMKADKKASRVAAEGKIAVTTEGDKAVLVEVNCETDFVGRDSSFLQFADNVANAAIGVEGDSVETLMTKEMEGETIEATRQALIAKIGENIQVRRMASRGGAGTTIGGYVHMNRIGVLVEMEGGSEELCTDIAMHVAAMNPPFATPDDVPAEFLDKERKFLSEQALESGKPPEIVEKMVEGRIRKYLEEICLVSQSYVKESDKTVGKLLEENGAKIIGFTRLAVGEGIEKKQDDFAAEVAQMAGGA